jgi:Ca-activated chloride channel homolog
MKRITVLALLISLSAVSLPSLSAQTRARRVGQSPQTQQPQQTQQPPQTRTPPQQQSDDESEMPRPSRPPVLGGANRDPNGQKPAPTSTPNSGPEEVGEGDIIRVSTTLVSIPVSVMDRDGKYIPNLSKEDFRVWEDGVEQQVAYFASTEKPFTVALLLDTSGSTRFKLDEIQNAAITFVNQLRPEDRVMVVSFDDRIRVLCQPTNDRYAIRNAIQQVDVGSGTRLYDAVDTVIRQHLSRIEGRKALVLFTDGVDTTSKRASYQSTVRDAEELDALVYPVEYDTYSDANMGGGGGGGWPGSGRGRGYPGRRGSGSVLGDILGGIFGGGVIIGGGGRGGGWPGGGGSGGTSRADYELADRYLNDLARVTGARLYNANQDLNYAFQMVAEELRRQYSLGYYPKRTPQQGERRSIKVRVNRPELVVRTRDSYVFGQSNGASAQGQQVPQQKPPVLKRDLTGGR